MAVKFRPAGLGSGIDKDRPDYTDFTGEREVGRIYQTPRRPRQSVLVLVADRQRPDDALGSRGDPGRGQGAISEELGRLEGVGEAEGGRIGEARLILPSPPAARWARTETSWSPLP